MKLNCKWVLALLPLLFAGCDDKVEQPDSPIAYEGDDVRFSVDNSPNSRTMYQDQWDEKTAQAIYWGNYVTGHDEFINIYCPDNPERGFARYKVNPKTDGNSNVAETIVKTSEIGVQWGASGKPYTFYAFYPADRASTTLENGNTIRATVLAAQSPQSYKYNETGVGGNQELKPIDNFITYNNQEYDSDNNKVKTTMAKTIYGMPEMNAAVMVARKTVPADKYGHDVPLRFQMLADVIDITLNGPITPNTLGGNKNTENPNGIKAEFIQIQAVTLEVVTPVENNSTGADGKPITDVSKFEINNNVPITGSFDFNMSESVSGTDAMITNVSGNAFVQLQISTTDADNKMSYPTLYVRTDINEGTTPQAADIDHMRLRAFLIPGQITGKTLNTLRLHLQTNCGDFYMMLENDDKFVSSKIYPVKLGYFKTRGEDFDLTSWIGQLDPNIYISELSIPGAWHAANPNNQGKDVTMLALYKAGIRAFEVHAKNGTDLIKYNDLTFKTPFDINSETENFEELFQVKRSATSTYNISNVTPNEGSGNGDGPGIFQDDWNINGTTYNRRRKVTGVGTCSETQNETGSIVPRFWLRLYRSATGSETEPISTAIINLAGQMNKSGLMFLEIGQEDASGVTVPTRGTRTIPYTRTQDNVTVTGYQYGHRTGNGFTGYNYEWENVYTWDGPVSGLTTTEWLPGDPTDDMTQGSISLSADEAWAIAVRSCLERISGTYNNKIGKNVLYEGQLNRFTTIKDVQGSVIAKINTNGSGNESSYLWGNNTPALFSRWISGSGKEPQTINLKWKAPVAPTPLVEDVEALHWCFTEREDVDHNDGTSIVSLEERKAAIIAMNSTAASNYKVGRHRTFYECAIGGYLTSAGESGSQALAKELNPFALARISNPNREPTPLGLVFMNYCIDPNNDYRSAELIRAIINNNKAFLLNRYNGTQEKPAVQNKVNSHFNSVAKNPLK